MEEKQVILQASEIIKKMKDYDFRDNCKSKTDHNLISMLCDMQKDISSILIDIFENSKEFSKSSQNMTELAAKLLEKSKLSYEKTNEADSYTNQMKDNMFTVSAAAEEISSNMDKVSNKVVESSQNINEVSQTTEQVANTIVEVVQFSEQAKSIVDNAVNIVNSATSDMKNLEEAARGIGFVTNTISGISDQTKLLALNATIEASRAGKAGIRFGVVAGEVKALAGETNKATEEIHQKVMVMQETAKNSYIAIEKINEVISDINNVVTKIVSTLENQLGATNTIKDNVNNVALGVSDISDVFTEANSAIKEVTQNISKAADFASFISERISEINTNAKSMQQDSTTLYAEAMGTLSHGDDILYELKKFKLGKSSQGRKEVFNFTKDFSVNVKDIDNEHRGIFDFMNKIHTAIKLNKSKEEIVSILDKFATWVIDHFAHEEEIMQAIDYPGYDTHKKIHTGLLNQVASIIDSLKKGEDVNLIEVLIFLKKWLIEHIMGTDQNYSSAMNENGYF